MDKDAKKNDKPVIQLFGNVVQQNADARDAEAKGAAAAEAKAAEAKAAAAAIADIAQRFCDDGSHHSAGFPKFSAQVPLPPNAKADPPVLPASALGSEKEFNEQKGKGKQHAKGGKPDYAKGGKPDYAKGGKDEKGCKNVAKGEFKGEFKGKEGEKGKQGDKGSGQPAPKTSGSKCARISEEPPEVVEGNSNKMHDAGAMTDGSKRRHEAVESNSDAESASSVIGSFSFISDTGDSPPMFPIVQAGLPPHTSGATIGLKPRSTMKKSISMCHSLHGSRIHIIGPAHFSRWAVLQRSPSPTMTSLSKFSTRAWRSAAMQRR